MFDTKACQYNYHLKRLLATDAKHLLFPFQEQNYFSVKLGKANNFTFPGENTGLGNVDTEIASLKYPLKINLR